MNFDILNQTENLFREIADFYIKWNAGRDNIVPILFEHRSILRRQKNRQSQRDRVLTSRHIASVPFTYSVPRPSGPPYRVTPYLLPPYKLSDVDIADWLFISRILPLKEEWLIIFRRELQIARSDAEERSRIDFCQTFQDLLSNLSEQLTLLDNRSTAIEERSTDWQYIEQGEDWSAIDRELRTLTNDHLRPLMKEYQQVVDLYSTVQRNTVEDWKPANQRTGRRTIEVNAAPPSQIKLSKHQTVLLMRYLRENGLVWEHIQDTTLARCFSVLTGFSENTLRQSVGDNPDETSSESDFRALIGHLETMLAKLKTDADKLF